METLQAEASLQGIQVNRWMNNPSTAGAKKCKWRKTRFPLTCCWGRHLEGAWSCPKSLSTPSRTSNWRKMCANSGKSTATVVDLRAVVRCWVNFLHALDIIKQQTQSCLRSLAKHSPHWHQNVFPTGEAGGHKSKSGSLSFSPDWASAAAASVSSTVLYSASCRSFCGVTSLLCEAKKKWEQNRRQTTMKKCYSFQKPTFDA